MKLQLTSTRGSTLLLFTSTSLLVTVDKLALFSKHFLETSFQLVMCTSILLSIHRNHSQNDIDKFKKHIYFNSTYLPFMFIFYCTFRTFFTSFAFSEQINGHICYLWIRQYTAISTPKSHLTVALRYSPTERAQFETAVRQERSQNSVSYRQETGMMISTNCQEYPCLG